MSENRQLKNILRSRGKRKRFSVEKDLRVFKRKHPTVAHLSPLMRSAYFGHFAKNSVPLEEVWGHVQRCEECSARYDKLVRDKRKAK